MEEVQIGPADRGARDFEHDVVRVLEARLGLLFDLDAPFSAKADCQHERPRSWFVGEMARAVASPKTAFATLGPIAPRDETRKIRANFSKKSPSARVAFRHDGARTC
jgi:hypothetical protein